jgi:hypothetical protein
MTQRGREAGTIVTAIRLQKLFEKHERLRTADVARMLGIGWDTAKYQLSTASLEIPLYQDEQKYWQILAESPQSEIV